MRDSANPVQAKNLGLIERWASVVGGATLLGYGMKKRSVAGSMLTILGGDLVYCGLMGYSPLHKAIGIRPQERPGKWVPIPYQHGVRVDRSITIQKPVEEVYSFWRNLENLPRFLQHLHSVSQIDGLHSHWIVQGPSGKTVEWDAEINNDVPNSLIGWRSLPGSEVDTAGSVHFKPAPDGRGTEVQIELQYNPPGGPLGALFARLMGNDPAKQIREDLRRLKQVIETGEIARTEGQSSGKDPIRNSKPRVKRARAGGTADDHVQTASEQSFPASDAPSWSAPQEEQVS